MWDGVVRCCWLEIVLVNEVSCVGATQPQLLLGVTVIDTVELLSLHEANHIVLHNWVLGHGGIMGTCGVETNCVTHGEHILELVVLKGVFVDVHHAVGITKTTLSNDWLWLGCWVNASSEEVLLNHLTTVDILHHSDLLSVGIALDLLHFPTEVNFDATLLALVKGNLVGVVKLVDLLVGSPVLHTTSGGSTSLHLVNAEEVLVVEGIEVTTFSLVWESWRVAHQVSHKIVPAIEEITVGTGWGVNHVNEGVLVVWLSVQGFEAGDVVHGVVETWGKDEGLVVPDLAVGEVDLVGQWVNLGSMAANLNLGPVLNLSIY